MQTSEGYQNALDKGQHSSMTETTSTRALRMLPTTQRQIKWPSQDGGTAILIAMYHACDLTLQILSL